MQDCLKLLALQVPDALLAGIYDPEAVDRCVRAGVGAEVRLEIGGKIDYIYSKPLPITGTVMSLPQGLPGSQKPDAVLQLEGVTLVLLSDHRVLRIKARNTLNISQ